MWSTFPEPSSPCVCVERKHINLHSSHCLPLNPAAQSQTKESPPLAHVPPFWQGRLRQSWGDSERQQLPSTSSVQTESGSQVSQCSTGSESVCPQSLEPSLPFFTTTCPPESHSVSFQGGVFLLNATKWSLHEFHECVAPPAVIN